MRGHAETNPTIKCVLAAFTIAAAAFFSTGFLAHAEEAYLPNPAAAKIVTAVPDGSARSGVVIFTQSLPGGQPDPQELKAYGVIYTFSPRVVFAYRDEPTSFSFWNLQTDENHDFMLAAPGGQVLMKMMLPQLKKTSVTLTFHKEGLYTFYCTMHQPEMSGQIFVLPPERR